MIGNSSRRDDVVLCFGCETVVDAVYRSGTGQAKLLPVSLQVIWLKIKILDDDRGSGFHQLPDHTAASHEVILWVAMQVARRC